jgi:hypothetical protein
MMNKYRTQQIEIYHGVRTWVGFRNNRDLYENWEGTRYHLELITHASRDRLARVLSAMPCTVCVDGTTFYYQFNRKEAK